MKTLVFLHGAGFDCNAHHDLMKQIASLLNTQLISFNAPFPHPTKENKFIWFNKIAQNGRRDAVNSDYNTTITYVKNKLLELAIDLKDIILIGHSQGGGIAAHVGLELDLGAVISMSADMPYNIDYKRKSNTPIYWFEAGQDGYIDDNRKASYTLLQHAGAKLHYQILPNSTHNEFADELLSALKKCFQIYNVGVYGDSIAFGYGNNNISWFDKLHKGKNALKLAQNGEKIANVLQKSKTDNKSYSTLIFAIGINDLLQISPLVTKRSFSDLLSQYEEILKRAKEKAQHVIVQSVLPVREDLFPNQDWLDIDMWAHNETITCFNTSLALLCQKLSIQFIDFYTVFEKQNLADLYCDAVHLNNEGQTFLKELYEKCKY